MRRLGFWETLFDDKISFTEASAINEAHEALSVLRSSSTAAQYGTGEQLQKLFALDRAQSRQLRRLADMVDVLTEILVESGALDRGELSSRVLARLAEIEKVEEAEGAVHEKVQCPVCVKWVAPSSTQITESGTVCDRCYYEQSKA